MSSGILTLAQQPRWLLLSLFLVLWSWSTGLRRDGKALGLGVDARAAPFWELKRQVGIPICAEQCALQAQEAIGCGDSLNLQCACHSAQFFPGAVDCMTSNCTASDKQNGQDTLMTACKAVGTSVSLPTSFTGTSTSITSGASAFLVMRTPFEHSFLVPHLVNFTSFDTRRASPLPGVPPISGSASSATTTTPPSSGSSSPPSGSGSGSQTATLTTTATAPPSSTTGTGSSTETGSGSATTASGTSTQASGSTPSSTSTGTSGNGAALRGVPWSAVAAGVALAMAGAAASL